MKEFFSKAPLFIFTYVSIIILLIATQFVGKLQVYFPEFLKVGTYTKEAVAVLTNEYDNTQKAQTTSAIAQSALLDLSDITESIKLTEEDLNEDICYEELLLPDIYKTNFRVEQLVAAKRGELQASGRGGFYSFGKVEKSYFDNVLFIGDSRTVGLSLYGDLDNATFAADVGMTIYDVFDRRCEGGGTVMDALRARRYGKIYIMLGINECGSGSPDKWVQAYSDVITQIQTLQPGAIVVIQSIMKVGSGKSASSTSINNNNINRRNTALKELANGWNIYYLDINPAVCDSDGNLPSNYSFDQVHLYAKYYYLWVDYLMSHGLK